MGRPLLLTAMLLAFFAASDPAYSQDPDFDGITRTTIMGTTLTSDTIDGSNNASNMLPAGTIVVYRTKQGRYGKFRVLRYGYTLWLKIVTYADNGAVHASADSVAIQGTWLCDLDSAKQALASLPGDFKWGIHTDTLRYLVPRNGAEFALYAATTGGKLLPEALPSSMTLFQNIPNPFNAFTRIRFGLPEAGYVRLAAFDQLGRAISVIMDKWEAAGVHDVGFDATGLPSGMYVIQLYAGGTVLTKRMLRLR